MKAGDQIYVRTANNPDIWHRVTISAIHDWHESEMPWVQYVKRSDAGHGSAYYEDIRHVSPLILLAEIAE